MGRNALISFDVFQDRRFKSESTCGNPTNNIGTDLSIGYDGA